MIGWGAERIAAAAGAELAAPPRTPARGPAGVEIDSRAINGGELFVGLAGEHLDGGRFAPTAVEAGAWGVLVAPAHAPTARAAAAGAGAAVLVHEDPLAALQSLAGSWRRALADAGARIVAITGSTGKTSTKDILAALLAGSLRTTSTPANLNTEIGLPLAILAAPEGSECLVLEMAMRGAGQIAELTSIAHPDVGVIVNVGPAHLELLGSLEAIAAAKAELIAGMAPETIAVLPANEPLLDGHRREDMTTVTFGAGGDVSLAERRADGTLVIAAGAERLELRPSFSQAHNIENLLAAVAAARTLGVRPGGDLEVRFSAMRGERVALGEGLVLIEDCYNANPMSTRAAIDELAAGASGRRVAVLGDMLELGASSARLHREIGRHASERGVELLITVGPLAAEIAAGFAGASRTLADATAAAEVVPALLEPGDTVLVKGSRGVALEAVCRALAESPRWGRPGAPVVVASGSPAGR